MHSPHSRLPFEFMTNDHGNFVGAIPGQNKDKKLHIIYYASHILDDAQLNYVTIEK